MEAGWPVGLVAAMAEEEARVAVRAVAAARGLAEVEATAPATAAAMATATPVVVATARAATVKVVAAPMGLKDAAVRQEVAAAVVVMEAG